MSLFPASCSEQAAHQVLTGHFAVLTKRSSADESASLQIDSRIVELNDWRGETLAALRALIKQADPEVVDEWTWKRWQAQVFPSGRARGLSALTRSIRVWAIDFSKAPALTVPAGLFNPCLEAKPIPDELSTSARAINSREQKLIELVRADATLNVQ